MPRVVFWNVQRMGEAGGDKLQKAFDALDKLSPDLTLLCEVATTSMYAQNLTYRKKNSAQLCYGCLDADGNTKILQQAVIEATDEYREAGYKGGSTFSKLVDRAVGWVPSANPAVFPHVYVIHAPASNNAVKAMSFIACALNEEHGSAALWLLVGDFNVEPDVLAEAPVGINMNDLIESSGRATHDGGKELDYCLSNFPVTVARTTTKFPSDHYAIRIDW